MSAIPVELQRLAWADALRKSEERDKARERFTEMFSDGRINQLRELYTAGEIDLDEYEVAVEAALHGSDMPIGTNQFGWPPQITGGRDA
jgi:hypothetical protein